MVDRAQNGRTDKSQKRSRSCHHLGVSTLWTRPTCAVAADDRVLTTLLLLRVAAVAAPSSTALE